MLGRRITLSILAAAMTLSVASGKVKGQIPEARTAMPPEQMVEEAFKKLKSGEAEEAMRLFGAARRANPTLEALKLLEGLLLIENHRQYEAIAILQEYNNTGTGQVDHRGFAAVGAIYKASRMYRQAVRPLERAKELAPLEEDGKHVRAEIAMELAYVQLGRVQKKKAIETAKAAAAMAPTDPKLQLQMAEIAAGSDEHGEATSAANRAIRMLNAKLVSSPFDAEAHQDLRSAYQLLAKLYKIEINNNSDDPLPYYNLAEVTRAIADVERRITLLTAREYALQATRLNPDKPEWLVFVAALEAEMGAVDDALDRLATVLQEDPNNQEAIQLRAKLKAR